jgi:apolipoprotein N-acyltransferase
MFGAAVVGFYWVPGTIARFSKFSPWVAWCLFGVGVAFVALRIAVVMALTTRLCRGRDKVILPAAAWVAIEYLWPSVFPWRLGHIALDWGVLPQVADLAGAYGVSFILVLAAVACSNVLRRRTSFKALVLPAAIVVAACGYGAWTLAALGRAVDQRETIRVAVVQAGDAPSRSIAHHRLRVNRALTMALTEPVDLICWPESSMMAVYPASIPSFKPADLAAASLNEMARPLAEAPAPILFGSASVPDDGPPLYNSAFLMDTDERLIGRYHKRVLIPFGEYIPGEQWFPSLHKFSRFKTMFRAGTSSAPLDVPDVARLGVLICYEDLLAPLAAALVRSGAEVLVNLTNDHWFGDTAALTQHHRLARFRAIETRRFLVRSTTTGATSVIAPSGTIAYQAPMQEPATLVADITPLQGLTPYAKFGDAFAWVCIVVCCVSWFTGRSRCEGGGDKDPAPPLA